MNRESNQMFLRFTSEKGSETSEKYIGVSSSGILIKFLLIFVLLAVHLKGTIICTGCHFEIVLKLKIQAKRRDHKERSLWNRIVSQNQRKSKIDKEISVPTKSPCRHNHNFSLLILVDQNRVSTSLVLRHQTTTKKIIIQNHPERVFFSTVTHIESENA